MSIPALDRPTMEAAAARQVRLTKPAGSLGRLEDLSVRLAGMTSRLDPALGDSSDLHAGRRPQRRARGREIACVLRKTHRSRGPMRVFCAEPTESVALLG